MNKVILTGDRPTGKNEQISRKLYLSGGYA